MLSDRHRQHLVNSGIAEDVIKERGARTVTRAEARAFGFAARQYRDGLLLPVHTTDGGCGLYVLRPDNPRIARNGKVIKYEMPKDLRVRIDCPPRCRARLGDPSVELWVTEGQKKADAGASHGLCVVALLGVWNFKGKNSFGGVTFLADWDYIALNGRRVSIVFDSDVTTKPEVKKALDRLVEHLHRKGATVDVVHLPSPSGAKVGLDDYLLTHSVGDLEALAQAPAPSPKAAPPSTELLEDRPLALQRLLAINDGNAYATTWLWTKTTVTESMVKGQIVRHVPPQERIQQNLYVIDRAGRVFGPGGDRPLDELGFDVRITAPPRDDRLWSAKGVKAYRRGYRPDPLDLFRRLTEVFDHFMSYDRSLAPQSVMCELSSCFVLVSWFLDAFTVAPYAWPNGDFGSGKTKDLILTCELSYLGEAVLGGSSYACLRDLADMGATLGFDDAEAMSDPRRSDPDKRNLLLSGNRKGSVVAVKEKGPNGEWKTRYVNTYCVRVFTATQVPDPILASRTIVKPMVRTGDTFRANRDVMDPSCWPCDRRQLLDDLWALGLAHLTELPVHEAAVNGDAPLVGRNLEPWRSILAVAHWLSKEAERAGDAYISKLYERMVDLAKVYQSERTSFEATDLTKLVVRALVEMVAPFAPCAPSAPFAQIGTPIEILTADVTKRVNRIAVEEEITDDLGPDFANEKQVGKVLSRLRLRQAPKRSGERRRRVTTVAEIDSIARSYGMKGLIPDTSIADDTDACHHESGQTEQTGQMGQAGQTSKPSTPCYCCGFSDWWQRSDGGWVCGVCHPPHH